MPMPEDEARTRLQGVTPGARPDVDAIIRTGRRRNRNAAIAGVTAAVVAIAGVGAGIALLSGRPPRDAVPAPLVTPSATPEPTPSAEPSATATPSGSPTPSSTPASAGPTASGTPAKPRTWPSIRGEAGGGLVADGTPVGRAMGEGPSMPTKDFIALMGEPDATTSSATCRNRPLTNTVHRWGDLLVVVLDEEDTSNDYGFAYPVGEVAGWVIDPTLDGQPGLSFPMTGPEGAQIGDTVPTLEELFPPTDWDYAAVDPDTHSFGIFAGDTTGASFPLDAQDKVRSMSAGYTCR